jgi:putative serine protease PepD
VTRHASGYADPVSAQGGGRRGSALLLGVVAVLAALIGGGVVALVDGDSDSDGDGTQAAVVATGTTGGGAPEGGTPAERVYRDSKDAVVFISAEVTEQTTTPFGTQSGTGTATGTGFVVADDAVVTNAHVIEGARAVSVRIGDGRARGAEVVGSDPSTDVALLRVSGAKLPNPLPIADSDDVVVGQAVYAIGNPYGLDRTLTGGLVSAVQREITAPNGFTISGVIQTDAAINPGNSGGPLLDSDGDVVGVTSQIISSGQGSGSTTGGNVGIGFAVPSNTVRNVVEQLERSGSVAHAYLGVATSDAPGDSGAVVGSVAGGGPAARAGLRPGDVIQSLGGAQVTSASDLTAAVNAHQPGEQVPVTVQRDGATRTVTVRLGRQPASASGTTAPTP